MKKRTLALHGAWLAFAIIITSLLMGKIDRYLDASVAYQEEACHHTAYMIYKSHDDQAESIKLEDWLTRIEECTIPSAKYMQGW